MENLKKILTLMITLSMVFSITTKKKMDQEQMNFIKKALNRLSVETTKIENEVATQLDLSTQKEKQALIDLLAKSNQIYDEKIKLQQTVEELQSEIHTNVTIAKYNGPPDQEMENKKRFVAAYQARITQLTQAEIEANATFNQVVSEKNTIIEKLTNIKTRKIEIMEINNAFKSFGKHSASLNSDSLTERIALSASLGSIQSNVTFKSFSEISQKETKGAIVKFQTFRQRDRKDPAMSVNEITETQQVLPIGLYFIWAERLGKPTSDKSRRFNIVEASESVKLVENQ